MKVLVLFIVLGINSLAYGQCGSRVVARVGCASVGRAVAVRVRIRSRMRVFRAVGTTYARVAPACVTEASVAHAARGAVPEYTLTGLPNCPTR